MSARMDDLQDIIQTIEGKVKNLDDENWTMGFVLVLVPYNEVGFNIAGVISNVNEPEGLKAILETARRKVDDEDFTDIADVFPKGH